MYQYLLPRIGEMYVESQNMCMRNTPSQRVDFSKITKTFCIILHNGNRDDNFTDKTEYFVRSVIISE